MLSDEQIQSYLELMENELTKKENRKKVELSASWVNRFPPVPGIYIAFEEGNLVYVGETGNIRG